MGLAGMILSMIQACDIDLSAIRADRLKALTAATPGRHRALAQLITALENGKAAAGLKDALHQAAKSIKVPTLGITGTGGAGKSSLTDELIRRFRLDQGDTLNIAVISIDPVAPQIRRRAAGRPHPHECHRAVERPVASSCARWPRAKLAPKSRKRCRT